EASPTSPVIGNETQVSMRTAVAVAREISVEANREFQKSDLYFSFGQNARSVEGTSAGAAMTIATLALLLDLKLNQTVAITGSINANGTIGPVGGVLQKASALRDSGYVLFIVPTGESIEKSTTVNEVQDCKERQLKNGVFRVCTVKHQASVNSIAVNETGISVVEVDDIRQAIELMVQN
ncbi:MAG: S16 family serine protease, partial [Candidatus Woesearchaeota archaeon]|nr:S16 family serine protease [Candidatus Woesearchaeota archaeon]